ncbi:formate dehydrogenase accessory sulfurtransferase FdhD [uncultured Kocuria sp.]|uniref:formate dehydrogenase accessory sulfurtransferase FdhD n=1 Tax=uncultured Kocuria sp. TaxID=259305 RepID=UPI00260F1D23|nr:formate dehydrogenase accessory sulfurtransferase FdhD [uncultured Kocuria sp.]
MTRASQRRRVHRYTADGDGTGRADTLAGEEPLEIRLDGRPFTVTMRTPGHDFDLVAGFLVSEGVVRAPSEIVQMDYRSGIGPDGQRTYNVVEVRLAPGVALPDTSMERHVYTSSSCGVCGTASIEAVTKVSAFDPAGDPVRLPVPAVLALPDRLRTGQKLFSTTGGVHAAGLFRLPDGAAATDGAAEPELLCVREDVGRHNAVDKVVGWALREGLLPLRSTVLQVSGRASFELVQKAYMAGVPALAAVSAPSALAVDLADEAGVTLLGFSRGTSFNAYAHRERLVP